ncbi:MAG: modification methylase [Microbacteriaceae bacterium]|nr:modification methylase [Microbacteriaceae bacterium]
MRTRIAASVVVAATLLLATTACTFLTPQSTLKVYSPSDGVDATVGQVEVRNAMLLSKDGQDASFVVSMVNDGQKDATVRIQYESKTASGSTHKVNTNVQLAGGEVKTFGSSDTRQLVFTGIDTKPGALFPVFVQYGSLTGDQMLVPVLNGALAPYGKLLPTPTPTPSPSLTPSPSGTPTPSGSPTPSPSPSN